MVDNNLGMADDEWLKVQADLNNYLEDFRDAYGENGGRNQEIRKETEEYIIFADASGHELNVIAEANGVDRSELSERMHKEARMKYEGDCAGDAWSVADPIIVYKNV